MHDIVKLTTPVAGIQELQLIPADVGTALLPS